MLNLKSGVAIPRQKSYYNMNRHILNPKEYRVGKTNEMSRN
jgi:hypothetical protein